MVHLSSSGKRVAAMVKVKEEEEEEEEEEEYLLEDQAVVTHHLHKRPKLDTSLTFLRSESDLSDVLEEPSPLGLRLKKSPSLLDLIQMKLSQEKTTPLSSLISKKVHKEKSGSAGTDKLKASNFPASLLKMGTWQYKSRYEGDLVAKCYYAKHKLVWEVLDGGLKNKIEIQWSDIVAIKANFPKDEPETLDVVLARQPLFFRETNPQPRKHTLWQATSDFTDGQASIHRRHFLQCHQGFLGKHFEKLIQCDPRLNILSQQPEIVVESPYFDQNFSAFRNLNESHEMPPANDKEITSSFSLRDVALGTGVLSSSLNDECQMSEVEPPEVISEVSPTHNKGNFTDQPIISNDKQTRGNISEEVAEYLLGDTEVVTSLDEQSLVSQVNSLRCILQKDHGTQSLMAKDRKDLVQEHGSTGETNYKNASGCEKGPVISRKDSVGDLLLELPRIASLPQFLYNM